MLHLCLRRHFCHRHSPHDPTHPLGGNIFGIILHLHKNELAVAAVLFVQIQYGMGRRSRTGEGVEDDVIRAAYDINKVGNQCRRFGKIEYFFAEYSC